MRALPAYIGQRPLGAFPLTHNRDLPSAVSQCRQSDSCLQAKVGQSALQRRAPLGGLNLTGPVAGSVGCSRNGRIGRVHCAHRRVCASARAQRQWERGRVHWPALIDPPHGSPCAGLGGVAATWRWPRRPCDLAGFDCVVHLAGQRRQQAVRCASGCGSQPNGQDRPNERTPVMVCERLRSACAVGLSPSSCAGDACRCCHAHRSVPSSSHIPLHVANARHSGQARQRSTAALALVYSGTARAMRDCATTNA